jgi:hypothetical protein
MPIFHKSAYLSACSEAPPTQLTRLTDAHFDEDWAKLAEALGWLTAEQLCNAVYGDWLLQLESVAGRTALLQVRSYLLGQGALAANYLAELAQNADDAADGTEAEIRVALEGDWLLFANNGRRVTPRNLLGLSRFFVHHAGEVVALTQETIGKFGIGFKSCYRIAAEVIVCSWDKQNSEICFRLPISCRELPESWPEAERLHRIVEGLRAQGERIGDAILGNHDKLGYGTPEFLHGLPTQVPAQARSMPRGERGTLFCFRLHAAGRREVIARIGILEQKLSELCPLFLRNVRTVQLGRQTLEMKVSRERKGDGLPGRVAAVRVELSTTSAEEGDASRENFWKLTGTAPDDRWQLALRADTQDRIARVSRSEGLTLGEGGAYAFFPLNAVDHPFRFHLHIDLPTNLARDNWNGNAAGDEATGALMGALAEQLNRAADGLTSWLEFQHERWHPDWRLEELYMRVPDEGHSVASTLHAAFQCAVREKKLLRTVWGDLCTGAEALAIELPLNSSVKRHWLEMAAALPHLREEFPFVPQSGRIDLGLESASVAVMRKFFIRAAERTDASSEWWLHFTGALFGSEEINAPTIQQVARSIPVPQVDGSTTTLAALLERTGAAQLAPEWHELFRSVARWFEDDHLRRGLAVFGQPLGPRISCLSTPGFSAEWDETPAKMAEESAWQAHGDDWWKEHGDDDPCPAGRRDDVLAVLRVRDGSGHWKLVRRTWLYGAANLACFHGAIDPWQTGTEVNLSRQSAALRRLDSWNLLSLYRAALTELIEDDLPERLWLKMQASDRPLAILTEPAHANSRGALEEKWRTLVEQAEAEALRNLLRAKSGELRGRTFLAEDIPFPMRALLGLLPGFGDLPKWLAGGGWAFIVARGLRDGTGCAVLTLGDLTAERKAELGRALLERFHTWQERELTPANCEALTQLCASANGQWSLSVSQGRKRRLEEFFHAGAVVTDAHLSEMLAHAGPVTWSMDRLPEPLAAIEPIAQACRQPRELRLTIEGQSRPLTEDRLHPELRTLPAMQRLLLAQPPLTLRLQTPLNLVWKARGGDTVCEIRDALFAVQDGQLIVSKAVGRPDERQYERVLGFYELCAHGDADFRAAREVDGVSAGDLYHRFRERILGVLRKELVADVGYTARHIVRELLQNAESAYASMPVPPPHCPFTLTVQAQQRGNELVVEARHRGRGFNQADCDGQIRPDIQRITSVRAELQNTADEVGRFNRGFKSLFTITERVRVCSAGYDFHIEDLLILDPSVPQADLTRDDGETRFSFRCSPAHAAQMLRSTGRHKLRVFDAADFVFLRHVTAVELEDRGERRAWSITRQAREDDWTEVEIREETPGGVAERFLVFHGTSTRADRELDRRFAVALALDPAGNPQPAAGERNRLFLTFPTETAGPFGFLVNGDFEIDRGRLEVRRDSVTALLLKEALETVVERLRAAARAGLSREAWLGWARTLAPEDARRALRTLFPRGDSVDLDSVLETAAGLLRQRVPHGDSWCRLDELEFPSRLLRRLLESAYREAWQIDANGWIDSLLAAEAEALLADKKSPLTLDDFVRERCRFDAALRVAIRAALVSAEFRESFVAGLIEAPKEIDAALARLASQETPVLMQSNLLAIGPDMAALLPQPISLEKVVSWWNSNAQPNEYTLDGSHWPLFFPEVPTLEGEARKVRLKAELSDPSSAAGRRLWYRVLGFACLLSAGQPVTRVQKFWTEKLNSLQFWEKTEGSFDAASAIFEELIHREFKSASAAGEDAAFWRRVFYDIQKVNRLVFEDQFAETVMDLVRLEPDRLVQFLRSGQLPGQPGWRGVLGQSAGSPLFFVIRELRRLRVIEDEAVDASAYFVCTAVRRLAARLGWISPELGARYDFESLQETSRRIYEKARETDHEELFAEWFDIPLLHFGLNHNL